MKTITVPSREQVSAVNQELFDNLKRKIGSVPNLFAVFAHSENALGTYLNLSNAKTSFRPKEKEAVNLIVSQVNGCEYCLAAHTAIAKMQGFTEEQTLEIRRADIKSDSKINALIKLAKSIVETKGHADDQHIANFYKAGYNEGSLIDLVMIIGDKTITNYIYALTGIPIDFPAAPSIN